MPLHSYSVYRKELETYMYQGSRFADMRSQLLRNSLKRSRSFWKQASDRGKIFIIYGTVKEINKKTFFCRMQTQTFCNFRQKPNYSAADNTDNYLVLELVSLWAVHPIARAAG